MIIPSSNALIFSLSILECKVKINSPYLQLKRIVTLTLQGKELQINVSYNQQLTFHRLPVDSCKEICTFEKN